MTRRGLGLNLMPLVAAMAGAPNASHASGAHLEFLFAERASLQPAAGVAQIGCVRANATATCFNRSGVLELAPQNTARLNFDPVTLRYENLIRQARNFGGGDWGKTAVTVTDNAAVSVDDLTLMDLITHTSGSTVISQTTTTFAAGSTITVAVDAKASASSFLRIELGNLCNCWFNLTTGTTATNSAGSGNVLFSSKGITDLGGGIYRCRMTVTTTSITSMTIAFQGTNSDNTGAVNGSAIYLDRVNVNTGSTALDFSNTDTSYKAKEYACKGLLVEESRINLETWSANYSNVAYTKVGLNAVTTNNAGAPDGTSTLNKLPEDSSTGLHTAVRNVTVSAGSTYTVSRFFKAAENSLVQLLFDDTATTNGVYANFNISAGTITKAIAAFGTGTAVTAGIESCGNGIYRAYIIGTAGTAATTARVAVTLINSGTATPFPSYTGVSGNGIYVWGSDTQLGGFLTSHIPTTSAAVTRNADVVTIGGVPVWFNETEGTILVEWDEPALAVTHWLAAIALDSSNRYGLAVNSANQFDGIVAASGSDTLSSSSPTVSAGVRKAALAYKADDGAISVDGAAAVQDPSVTLPTGLTTAHLGSSNTGGSSANCHIRRFAYFRTRQDNTYLAALTA